MRTEVAKPLIKGFVIQENKILIKPVTQSRSCATFDINKYMSERLGKIAKCEYDGDHLSITINDKNKSIVKKILSKNLNFVKLYTTKYPFVLIKETYTGDKPPFKTLLVLQPQPLAERKLIFGLISQIIKKFGDGFTCYLTTCDDKELRGKIKKFLGEDGKLNVDINQFSKFLEVFWDAYLKVGAIPLEDELLTIKSDSVSIWLTPRGNFFIDGTKLAEVGKILIKSKK